mgnify:CR=1 FL=1
MKNWCYRSLWFWPSPAQLQHFAAIPQNIRIGTDPTYAPFESKNSQGELVGFDIDLAKELCKRINTQGWKEMLRHSMELFD